MSHDYGMPFLLETPTIADAAALCAELGLSFVELNLNFPECQAERLDVQQLRRVFDNLASNVCKYADPALPVTLEVSLVEGKLLIRQTNGVLRRSGQAEGYGLGLDSIRRIAASYSGSVTVEEKDGQFRIDILLRDI